jgi:hypothetical protein
MPVQVGYPRPRSARCHRQRSRCLLRRCDAGIAAPARSETPRGNPVMLTAITARQTSDQANECGQADAGSTGDMSDPRHATRRSARKESPLARQRLSSNLPNVHASHDDLRRGKCGAGQDLQDRLEVVRDRLRGRSQDDLSQRPHHDPDLRIHGALGGTRTPNLLIRSQMLYPLSYERWCPDSLRHPGYRCGLCSPAPRQALSCKGRSRDTMSTAVP